MEKASEQEIEQLLSKAHEARVNNLPHSIELAQHCVNLAQSENPNLYAKALNQLGLYYMIIGEFQKALETSTKALSYFEEINNLKGIADAKYNIGSVHYKTDSFFLGLQYLLDCLQLYRQLRDLKNEARVLKAVGTVYEYFGDLNNAIDSYTQSIQVAEKINDSSMIANAYNPLSGIYLKQGKIDIALSLIQKSVEIKQQTKDVRGLAFSLYGRGKVYLQLGRYQEAMSDLVESLQLQKSMGDKLGEGMAYNKIGLIHLALREYLEAHQFFSDALHIAETFNIQFIRFKACYNLFLLAREQQKLPEQIFYLEKYITYKEAVINTHTYNVIKSYESIAKVEALEQEAQAQKEKAEIIERKNAELDSFFYRISHDLKGPISSLLGLYNLVKIEIRDDLSLRYFELYQSQIMRINNIVMDLINLIRMNHTSEAKAKIDFKSLVDDCILSYSYHMNFKKIAFIREIDSDLTFYSEWAIVNTILQNLIENAIKYARTDIDPFVKIFVSKEADKIKIEVQDNGQGILENHQPRIFDMFYRANDRTQGTGLGLYILKRAVDRLYGEISFTSKLNEGTHFTIWLPIQQYHC